MTELSALAGSERWGACDEVQLREPTKCSVGNPRSAVLGTREVHSALRGGGGATKRLSFPACDDAAKDKQSATTKLQRNHTLMR